MRGLYSMVMRGAQPMLRSKLRRRGAAEPGYLHAIDERFGRYEQPATPGALWIHAVSLGESRAAGILLEALRERDPGLRVLLTHGTATGREEGQRLLRKGDQQAWLPWDTPQAVARFLDHFRPRAGVLMETEVWPNLAAACRQHGVPLLLANARLSEQSLRKALLLRGLSRAAYGELSAVWAQTDADAQRLARAGARAGARASSVFGNLKFDAQPDVTLLARGRTWHAQAPGPVVMFASSREGEEAELFRVLAGRRATDTAVGSAIRWLVVPRHPQRFDEVAQAAQQAGFTVSRRSSWAAGAPQAAEVWIGDSLGEMAAYYGLSDVALLGGSFLPLGGQNLIEAAACGCPVVMGPHTFNFAEAAQRAEAEGAALRVQSMDEGVGAAAALLADPARLHQAATCATAFSQAHRGAAARTADSIVALLNAR